jgi:ribonuclease VapC
MIVDSSALVAILTDESGSTVLNDLLISTDGSAVSAASYLETGIVLDRHRRGPVSDALDDYLEGARLSVAPVTARQARIARAAYRDFGRGSGHPAKLNFGDCFAYALAIERDEPLLFKGDDFTHTDVRSALH